MQNTKYKTLLLWSSGLELHPMSQASPYLLSISHSTKIVKWNFLWNDLKTVAWHTNISQVIEDNQAGPSSLTGYPQIKPSGTRCCNGRKCQAAISWWNIFRSAQPVLISVDSCPLVSCVFCCRREFGILYLGAIRRAKVGHGFLNDLFYFPLTNL